MAFKREVLIIKIRKRLLVYAIIGILIIVLVLVINYRKDIENNDEASDEIAIQATLFSAGSEAYYFTVSYNGMLEVFYSEMCNIDLSKSDLRPSMALYGRTELTPEELQTLLDMADLVEKHKDTDALKWRDNTGMWHSLLSYNGENYLLNYTGARSDIATNLFDKLIELAPMQMRDENGYLIRYPSDQPLELSEEQLQWLTQDFTTSRD